MKVTKLTLVTGACGFIGQHLVRQLLSTGQRVVALVHQQDLLRERHEDLKLQTGDLTEPQSLVKAVDGCDTVYHLASLVKLWTRRMEQFDEVNVQGTENLLLACRDAGVRRVVICSTCGIFGRSIAGRAVNETQPIDPGQFGPYEASKYRQMLISEQFRSPRLEIVYAFPTRVYGPGSYSESNTLTNMIRKVAEGKRCLVPGDGMSIGNYVYVEDVAHGLWLAMERGISGEGYILAGENLSFNQLFRLVGEVSGSSQSPRRIPAWLLKTVAPIEEWRARLFHSRPLVTRHGVKKYLADCLVSHQKASQSLGYAPTPIKTAIERTLAASSASAVPLEH